jgi:hypothetical protein
MYGRRLCEALLKLIEVHLRDFLHVEMPETVLKPEGAGECRFSADALVIEQAEKDRVRILAKTIVVLNVAGQSSFLLKSLDHADEPAGNVAVVDMRNLNSHGCGGVS